jgi:hypothetical protein
MRRWLGMSDNPPIMPPPDLPDPDAPVPVEEPPTGIPVPDGEDAPPVRLGKEAVLF